MKRAGALQETAIAHLSRQDRKLAALISKVGPLDFSPIRRRTPFAALTQSVIGQQLSGAAAGRILGRFVASLPSGRKMLPADVLALPDEAFRAAGLSLAKVATVRELARQAAAATLLSGAQAAKMGDEEIVASLVALKGIGRWTAEMFLIFTLGRPDVLPAGDFSVRKGFALIHGLDQLPKPRELLAHAEVWRPYRTTAALYLYRAVDLGRA